MQKEKLKKKTLQILQETEERTKQKSHHPQLLLYHTQTGRLRRRKKPKPTKKNKNNVKPGYFRTCRCFHLINLK